MREIPLLNGPFNTIQIRRLYPGRPLDAMAKAQPLDKAITIIAVAHVNALRLLSRVSEGSLALHRYCGGICAQYHGSVTFLSIFRHWKAECGCSKQSKRVSGDGGSVELDDGAMLRQGDRCRNPSSGEEKLLAKRHVASWVLPDGAAAVWGENRRDCCGQQATRSGGVRGRGCDQHWYDDVVFANLPLSLSNPRISSS